MENVSKRHNKPVILIDINNNTTEMYNSIASVAKKFNVTTGTISKYIKRKKIYKKSYMFIFASEYNGHHHIPGRFKVNIHSLDGKYITTTNTIAELKSFIKAKNVDSEVLRNKMDSNYRIGKYMFSSLEKNPDCNDIVPYTSHAYCSSKQVVQYDLEGNIVNTFPSITEAAIHTGINRATISAIIHRRMRYTQGFIFRFIDDNKIFDFDDKKVIFYKYKDEIMNSNLSDECKQELIKLLG